MNNLGMAMGPAATHRAPQALHEGTHVITPRRWYCHHGIYIGNGQVVHYAGFKSLLRRGPVECTTLDTFADGHGIEVGTVQHARYGGADVVRRATSRLGEDAYHLLRNNCEHFCNWCVHGTPTSMQVERLAHDPLRALLATACLLHAWIWARVYAGRGAPIHMLGPVSGMWIGAWQRILINAHRVVSPAGRIWMRFCGVASFLGSASRRTPSA